jgi:hypothetical protein
MSKRAKKPQDSIWGCTRLTTRLFKVGKYFQWIGNEGSKSENPVSPLFTTREAAWYFARCCAGTASMQWLSDEDWKEFHPLPVHFPEISKYKPTKKPVCQTQP